jgi:hypothetical protein
MTTSSLRLLLATILSLPLLSCGSGDTTTQADSSAGITFQLKWPSAKMVASAPTGVTTVRISVSAADMTTVSKDFSATAGSGSLPGVTPGSGRTISIVGLDASSVVIYVKHIRDVTLSTGQIYDCGPVSMIANATRFVDKGNGTIYDTASNLTWLKSANCTETVGGIAKTSGYLTWTDALTWSNNLASGKCGLTDGSSAGAWHLPTIEELRIFVDDGYTANTLISAGFFISAQSIPFWSSSNYASVTTSAWFVLMYNGIVDHYNKTYNGYVWPVRAGQ